MKKIPTGIKGFDKLVDGGFPKGHTVLLCGTPGTGKTIFALEYVYNGVKKYKEKSMYLSFEQSVQDILNQGKQFGWNLAPLIKSKKLIIKHIPIREIDNHTADSIIKLINKEKIQRVVIDSLSTLSANAPIYAQIKDMALVDIMKQKSFFSPPIIGDFIVKKFIYEFISDLQHNTSSTPLLISEATEKGEFMTRDTVSEFISDGVIQMIFESMGGDFSRSLLVRKMRTTKCDEDIHPVEISDKGIIVHDVE